MSSHSRREEIRQIAARLFAQQGFKNTTIKHIADAAGVRSATLYHHFSSKEAIVDEILRSFQDDLFGTYQSLLTSSLDPREKLVRAIEASFNATELERDAVTIFENEAEFLGQQPRFGYLAERNADSRAFWTSLLAEGVDSGALRPDLDLDLAYHLIQNTVWVAPRWSRSDGASGTEQIRDGFLAIFFEGATPRA
ncbi:TetR/AcrR family transcriptional regulator [Nocardioides soli]|uniref:AcrR family transcriptional regulator n=1 Tax=Nocardioides soli TaxID=1036020 RepID=A0A7W4VWZ0_9ACTN|nr:TetR/AcrR family transcriptional regulator [Nocardioides soli]MBB3043200.1 AcrR family transcriptional regulator [Nocardioides soli]